MEEALQYGWPHNKGRNCRAKDGSLSAAEGLPAVGRLGVGWFTWTKPMAFVADRHRQLLTASMSRGLQLGALLSCTQIERLLPDDDQGHPDGVAHDLRRTCTDTQLL